MGIKNLSNFLSKYPNILNNKNIKDLYGKKIAIDISLLLYQSIINIRRSGVDLINDKGHITSHILGLFNKTILFLENGIIPVYVFDGKPSILKQSILTNRKLTKTKALKNFKQAKTEQDKIKYFKRTVSISKEQFQECRELLTLMGIPYIDAPEEADSYLSYLCKNNLVYAVLTDDMDILTFGSPRIIKNIFNSQKPLVDIELSNILSSLNLNYEEFIDLCVLFGCDYCSNSNFNQNEIYSIYLKTKSLPDTLNELKKLNYSINDIKSYTDAKTYFINKSKEVPLEKLNLQYTKPDINLLLELLVGKYGLIKFIILNKINILLKTYELFKNI